MILVYFILLLVVCYSLFFLPQFANIIFHRYAPFISTDKAILKRIIDDVHIPAQGTVYELGCGYARFLQMVGETFPQTRLIGIENLFSLYLITKIKLLWQGSKIQLLKTDFFSVDLKTADVIYCYLNNTTMWRLGAKFKQECKSGTQIISQSFPIPQLIPEKSIDIKAKKIFFYTI